jgi:hypothetical protein
VNGVAKDDELESGTLASALTSCATPASALSPAKAHGEAPMQMTEDDEHGSLATLTRQTARLRS